MLWFFLGLMVDVRVDDVLAGVVSVVVHVVVSLGRVAVVSVNDGVAVVVRVAVVLGMALLLLVLMMLLLVLLVLLSVLLMLLLLFL